jgi:hypothetical protein
MPGALSAAEIRVGGTGTVYVAPDGTAGPANITAAWTGFVNQGYTTEEGARIARSMDTEMVKVWQSISVVRYLITGIDLTAAFDLMQFNRDTIPLYFGGGSIVNQGGGSFRYDISSTPTIDERVLGIEWIDGSITYRFVIGRGMVKETGESSVTRTAAISLPMTFGAMTPDSGSVLGYMVTNDTSWA